MKDPMQLPRNKSRTHFLCQVIIFISTIAAMVCLLIRDYYKMTWCNKFIQNSPEDPLHIHFMYDEVINNAVTTDFGSPKPFFDTWNVLELIMLCNTPLPFFDKYITLDSDGASRVTFLLSDFFFAFMFLRLFQLMRTSFNFSVYTDPLSKKICKGYGLSANFKFAVQSKLLVDPFETVIIMFVGTVLIFAYLVRIFELPY